MSNKPFNSKITQKLKQLRKQEKLPLIMQGKLDKVVGLTMVASGCSEPIGSRVYLVSSNDEQIEAEVVGFKEGKSYLMSIGSTQGVAPGAQVVPTEHSANIPVSMNMLGRVLNGAGKPIDGLGPIITSDYYPLMAKPINPLEREPINMPLDVGVRAINAGLTIGRGQRMGLFAGSGVGKSVLLSMMTKYTEADVIVVGLIGERGREVKEFIETNLGEEGLRRSVIVASPADESPLMRLHGAMVATTIAEFFRDQGQHVLLLMDSLTRFAQAQREIGLSIGEPPTTKGYPPSVFAKLPQLVERAGNSHEDTGSITALYTVLTEGDDNQDPIADASRAILDGHIVLSRKLAEAGHFPAIDIEQSISRVMTSIVEDVHQKFASELKHLISVYNKNQDLISIGAYTAGNDPVLDKAVAMHELIMAYLRQNVDEKISFQTSIEQLNQIFTT